jgi:hypothetical protein
LLKHGKALIILSFTFQSLFNEAFIKFPISKDVLFQNGKSDGSRAFGIVAKRSGAVAFARAIKQAGMRN